MFEGLNEFFAATYIYNKAFYAVQLLAVMSLMGIGMGAANQLLFRKNR
ncbi:MAG: MFS transporter [Firmicutes bacterium]|nr:MFS transporter [Bacillota bacterium]